MNINKSRSKIFLNDYIFFLLFDFCTMFYLLIDVLFFLRAVWSSAARLVLPNAGQRRRYVNILLRSAVHYPLFLLQQHRLKLMIVSLLDFVPIATFFIGALLAIRFDPYHEVPEILIASRIIVFE